MKMRLQKLLARAGIASRRKCEELIAAGRVTVNGDVVTEMGVQADPDIDIVEFDGTRVSIAPEDVVIALNKPAGVFTTMHEQEGRACVADLLPLEEYPSLYHVGRLDKDTTGILLFTTDGQLGNKLLHPAFHVDKEYLAQVRGVPSESSLERLRRGIRIQQGERVLDCAPAHAEVLEKLPKRYRVQDSCLEPGKQGTSIVLVRIHEGAKHQVKIMLKEIGHPVVNLHRARFGSVECGTLKQGEWRFVDPEELA